MWEKIVDKNRDTKGAVSESFSVVRPRQVGWIWRTLHHTDTLHSRSECQHSHIVGKRKSSFRLYRELLVTSE